MSVYQPPPGEARPYPAKVQTVLFPDPWKVASFSGGVPVELVRTVFDAAYSSWRTHMNLEA